jgi:tetratricopeptide (TPR) repeat protein
VTIDDITVDVDRLNRLVEADKIKKEADNLFSENRLVDAASRYSEALRIIPYFVSCLSNRSACYLALGQKEDCIQDCTAALDLLQLDLQALDRKPAVSNNSTDTPLSISAHQQLYSDSKNQALNMISAILPSLGSDKRKSYVLKTLTRRGATFAHVGRFDEAIGDFSVAVSLDPANEALKSDLNKLKSLKEGSRIAKATSVERLNEAKKIDYPDESMTN